MKKRVNIIYATFFTDHFFGFRFQYQVLEYMKLQMVWILLPNRFDQVNERIDTARNTPFPETECLWNGINFMMSTLQCIIVLGDTYKIQKIEIIDVRCAVHYFT